MKVHETEKNTHTARWQNLSRQLPNAILRMCRVTNGIVEWILDTSLASHQLPHCWLAWGISGLRPVVRPNTDVRAVVEALASGGGDDLFAGAGRSSGAK